jgi:hypothetical protein
MTLTQDEIDLVEYRKHVMLAEQKAQEDFDKTVITLSGGALGVSFAFIGNVIRDKPLVNEEFLFYAWWSWAASVSFVLVSYFLSIRSLRTALRQAYAGSIHTQRPGRTYAIATDVCNIVGGVLFFVGILLIAIFVRHNLGK